MTPSPPLKARLEPDEVVRVYERTAPWYDAWARLTESRAQRRCLEMAAVRDGESVLEVAAGTGLTFSGLLRANPQGRTLGVDLTEGMLRRARVRAARTVREVKGHQGRYELQQGDAHRLPFEDASFDLLVNNYMFDLLPEADFLPVLTEFRRVLRPGGRLVLVNMTGAERFWHGIAETVYRINPAWMGGCRGVRLAPYVEQAGFENLQREYLAQASFPSEILVARKPGKAPA